MPSPVRRSALALALVFLFAACGGGGGGTGPGPATPAPTNLVYASPTAIYPPQSVVTPNAPTWGGGDPTLFSVTPALPPGVTLDPATGIVAGTTTKVLAARRTYTVTAANAGGATTAPIEITVGPFDTLSAGFTAELVADGLATPVRIAELPDGRILFNELETGDTRVMGADGTLQAEAFSHTDVLIGGHRGLLGLVLHPDYATNGWVYLSACVAGTLGLEDRQVVKRYTAVETMPGVLQGSNETTVVDTLPVATIDNGGDLAFDHSTPSPRLFMSIGDAEDETNSQEVGGLAGRILRLTDEGAIPADNPSSSDPTWCLGLRNTFAIAVQPTEGDLWGADNGPAANDELNFLRDGKNFEWGGLPPGTPAADIGIQVATWADVIVPTAMAWHDGTGWGAEYANDLFLTSYGDEAIRRFRLSGLSFLDVDEEILFATFRPQGIANKPLDVEVAGDGSLLVSTFTAVYRVRKDP